MCFSYHMHVNYLYWHSNCKNYILKSAEARVGVDQARGRPRGRPYINSKHFGVYLSLASAFIAKSYQISSFQVDVFVGFFYRYDTSFHPEIFVLFYVICCMLETLTTCPCLLWGATHLKICFLICTKFLENVCTSCLKAAHESTVTTHLKEHQASRGDE